MEFYGTDEETIVKILDRYFIIQGQEPCRTIDGPWYEEIKSLPPDFKRCSDNEDLYDVASYILLHDFDIENLFPRMEKHETYEDYLERDRRKLSKKNIEFLEHAIAAWHRQENQGEF